MQIMTDTHRVIDWIMESDDAKKYDIRFTEKKLFGITIYKKVTMFQNIMNIEEKELKTPNPVCERRCVI